MQRASEDLRYIRTCPLRHRFPRHASLKALEGRINHPACLPSMHFFRPVTVDLVLMAMRAILGRLHPAALDSSITTADDIVLFDAPAFVDPANPSASATLAAFDAFVFVRQANVTPAAIAIRDLLSAFGVDTGGSLSNLANRAKLFAAEGLGSKNVDLNVQGCTAQVSLSKTAGLPDTGLFNQNVSLGKCGFKSDSVYNATVALSPSDNRTISSSIFFYSDSGFGVISGTSVHYASADQLTYQPRY